MQEKIFQTPHGFHWIDVIAPKADELHALATSHSLPPTAVQDCLQPEHLPKFEKFGDNTFIIVRAHDEGKTAKADTVQSLTRKVAIFFGPQFLITIHRKDQVYLQDLRAKWKTGGDALPGAGSILVTELLSAAFQSYRKPLEEALLLVDQFETGVFGAAGGVKFSLKHGYYLKRQGFLIKRILRSSLDLLPKLEAVLPGEGPRVQSLKDDVESLVFMADELLENLSNVLNLHLALMSQRTNDASFRTNEVVRVLTIFSVFLLPLHLLAGIYGMNFEHMPETKWLYGYPFALGLMATVTLGIYLWFRKKGWMK